MVYIPHVLAVGAKVIGFLPGYLQQEGYANGTRFGIIGLVVTGKLAIAMAVLILATVAFAVLQFSDPDRPWQGAVIMTAAALAVTTPRYEWYALLLVMLVALDGRPEWLAFAAGAYYAAEPNLGRYTIPNRLHDAVAYGVPVVVVAVGWLIREFARRRGGRPGAGAGPGRSRGGGRCAGPGGGPGYGRGSSAAAGARRRGPGLSPARPGLGDRSFLTGWLPVSQTSNGRGR